MVRFNISTYTTPLDDEKKYKNKLKLIHRFHKIATIKESVDNKENIIKVSSSSDNDFIQHFITLRHSTTRLNNDQIKVKKKLDDIINKRLNNNLEIYYKTVIYPSVSVSDIFTIIHNTEHVYSYICMNTTFFICILDRKTNFTSILEFSTNKICDGWSPKFDLDDGFYDQWYKDLREKELKILNTCYQDWLINNNNNIKMLFHSLEYKNMEE